jgi:aspartate/methionine/tyrosine aminotransferase
MRSRMLPQSGTNKFQDIKAAMKVAESKGIKLIKLSIGQPAGPALWPVRNAASLASLSEAESMWEYQDNSLPGVPGFAEKFVQAHVKTNLSKISSQSLSYLAVPGIKPTLFVVAAAMGSWIDGANPVHIYTMTAPGYPSPYDQALMLKGVIVHHLPMSEENDFLFPTEFLHQVPIGSLLSFNLPHNPTGAIGKKYWLEEVCRICSERKIRIFNDAAYAILMHSSIGSTLTDVALKFPNLNWAEAFSSSKAGNNCGTRVAAVVGSPEFMEDIAQINGNMNSGLSAVMAAGVLELFEKHKLLVDGVREVYAKRLYLLIDLLTKQGMRMAVEPHAGFFALFKCPKKAFGVEITSAKQFNELMINNTGVVGVDFDPYIRYAVCTTDIEAEAVAIAKAFRTANVSY